MTSRRHRTVLVAVGVAFALVLVAATYTVVQLHQRADRERQVETLLTRLDGQADELSLWERSATARQVVDDVIRENTHTVRQTAEATQRQLEDLGDDDDGQGQVYAAIQRYKDATDDEFRLIEAKQPAEARRLNAEQVAPSFAALKEQLAQSIALTGDHADAANRVAELGFVATMGASAVAVALLFWLFERTRRTADRAVVEQATLRTSEERFRSLIQYSSDLITITDRDGTFQYVSPSVSQVLGYSPASLIGTRIADTIHPDDAARIERFLVSASQQPGVSPRVEYRHRHQNDSWRYFEALTNNLLDTPVVNGIVITSRDITERKVAELELRETLTRAEALYTDAERARGQANAMFDATSEAMLLISADQRVLALNRPFVELFGVAPAEVVDAPFSTLTDLLARAVVDPAGFTARLTEAIAEGHEPFKEVISQRWPVARELAMFATPVHSANDDYIGWLLTYRDITHEREVDRMKTEFVSLVSHELRSPLTSIKGYVDLLIEEEVGAISAEQRDFLGIVKSNADRLVALINDLLDVSRIESGKIELRREPLDLGRIIEGVARLLQPQIEAKQQQLVLELEPGLPAVVGDHDRVTQILTNLLSNAYKYTPAGGDITVRAGLDGGFVRIEVQDTGIGLTESEQAQLFDKFFRADNATTREVGGTGLGLAIVRSLVEMHGGTITLTSAPDWGTTFRVSLPVSTAERIVPLQTEPLIPADGCILIVEDEPDIANLIRRYLERAGYRVYLAYTAADALRLAQQEQPDLITLDVMLPDTNGFELLTWLKNDASTMAIPVIMISVVPDSGRGALLGAVDHLTKPVQEQTLLTRVAQILGGEGAQKVVVADDEPDIRALLAGHLRRAGYAVVEAADGAEAVMAAQQEQPGLVLMDIYMPFMDGIAALRALRADRDTQGIPVVMMTASLSAMEENRSVIEALGGVTLPAKPRTAADLAVAITRSLASRL